ncbi:cytochrome c family protein [Phenylobacterium sp.]|uniref:c-type cytochrome n=1 Tax=Phenylobacterium sp. TaxID=1871053 RepID=UPI00273495E2|nr:c-type cytochrome [Phenylobacterium sp.]MDP3852786.1 c-type cytochrome [Phenylobacterium sp.]
MTRSAMMFAVAALMTASPALAADGAKTFQLQCKTCHAAKSTAMGPSLTGVAGRKVASLPDFKYSAALTAKGGTWTDASLDTYLAAPLKFAPGGKMMISVTNPADRAAVAAYLKTLK